VVASAISFVGPTRRPGRLSSCFEVSCVSCEGRRPHGQGRYGRDAAP